MRWYYAVEFKVDKMKIAVLVPCYNEEAAIATVVKDFRAALPGAVIYVYDNNSRDQTSARAAEAGAVVRNESRQGKGNVVRRMFADVEADIYVLVDGDDTYDAPHDFSDDRRGRRPADRPAHPYRCRRLSPRPCAGQPSTDGPDISSVQRASVGHAERLPDFLAAFCEKLSLHRRGVRHRDRADRPCRAADDAHVGNGHPLQGAPGGFGEQAEHLSRRLPHPGDHRLSDARGAAAGLLCHHRHFLRRRGGLYRRPGGVRLCPYRAGAAPAHRGAGHRPDGDRIPVPDLRPDPGHGNARPLGGQAHGLSRHPEPRFRAVDF
jgi:hypothetical protein